MKRILIRLTIFFFVVYGFLLTVLGTFTHPIFVLLVAGIISLAWPKRKVT